MLKSFSGREPVRIGIFESGFKMATIIDRTRLSSKLITDLSTPSAELSKILQGNAFGFSPEEELIQDFHYINAILAKMGLAKEQRYALLSRYFISSKTRSRQRHGNAVARLLTGKSPFGVSALGEIDFLFLSLKDYPPAVDKDTLKVTLDMTGNIHRLSLVVDSLPDIVNISAKFDPLGGWFTPSGIQQQFAKIAQKTLVVASAGNGFPDPIESGKRELFDKLILVGSTKPSGCVTSYSPNNDKVTICAPSDSRVLQTSDEDGAIAFGGTSGATPLVTGALADVLSFLPTMTVSEAKRILQETAIIGRDGTAILNYYKLIRVAIRLANIGWPEHRELIFSDDLYDFTDEVNQYLAVIDNSSQFTNLRQAFFLQPDNNIARERLSKIYAQQGYETQALFYGNDSIPPRDARKHDYLTAIAEADTERLEQILATTDDRDFYNNVIIGHLLQHMDKDKMPGVVAVLRENNINTP